MSSVVEISKNMTDESPLTTLKKRKDSDAIQSPESDEPRDLKKLKVDAVSSVAIKNKESGFEEQDSALVNGEANPAEMLIRNTSTFREVCDKWSHEVESAFISALRLILKNGTYKIKLLDKNYGRNELISIYIQYKTTEVRTKKQISSHIQVWKKAILNKMANGVPLSELEKEVLRLIEHGVQQNGHTVKLFYSVFEEIIDPMSCKSDNIKVSRGQSNLLVANNNQIHQTAQGQAPMVDVQQVLLQHQYSSLPQQNQPYAYPRANSIPLITDSNQMRPLQPSRMHANINIPITSQSNSSYPQLNRLRVLSESNIYTSNSMHDNNLNKNSISYNSHIHQPNVQNEYSNSYTTTSSVLTNMNRNNSIVSQLDDPHSTDKNRLQSSLNPSNNVYGTITPTNPNNYSSQYSSLKLPPVSTIPTYGVNTYKKYTQTPGDTSQRLSIGNIHSTTTSRTPTSIQSSEARPSSTERTSPNQQQSFSSPHLIAYHQTNKNLDKSVIPMYSSQSRYPHHGSSQGPLPQSISEHPVPGLSNASTVDSTPSSMIIPPQQQLHYQQRSGLGLPTSSQSMYPQLQKLQHVVNQQVQDDSKPSHEYLHYK